MTRLLITATVLIQLCDAALVAQALAPQAESPGAAAAVRALAQAISRRDRGAVADMVRYPPTVTVGGIGIPIRSRAEMLNVYDAVFTAELRCLVDESAAKGAGAIRVYAGGASFGDGRIHLEDVGGMFKIRSINVPPATGAAAPPNAPPRRVSLKRGIAQYSGRLYGDGADSYILTARRGDVVQARIEQFPGRSAALRVVEQKTGKALAQPGAAAPRLWSGTIKEPGDYHIDVVRLAPYCMPSFTYLLTITVK